MKIKVAEVIGKSTATVREDGVKVYDEVVKSLENNEKITIDFFGLSIVISSFLNAAIGSLYGVFSDDELAKRVVIVGLDEDDQELLNEVVIPNAKSFFSDADKIKEIEGRTLGEQ